MMDSGTSVTRKEFQSPSKVFRLSVERMGWLFTEMAKTIASADGDGSSRCYEFCPGHCEKLLP